MNEKELLGQLKTRLQEVDDLYKAGAVLGWDQSTYMPPGGSAARGRQLATLGRVAHERATDPEIGRLLDALQPWADKLSPDNDDACIIRNARRAYDRNVKVPVALVGELNSHLAVTYDAWAKARPANDFGMVREGLQKTVDLSRKLAECFAPYEHIMDPLIDMSDYGMKVSTVSVIFADLRKQLVPMVQAITAQAPADDSLLRRKYPEQKQWDFGMSVAKRIGYDIERGRQDKTHHPFCTTFSIGDVRITTRFDENNLGDGFFSTIHETGHAMYEQGVDPKYEATPLAGGASAGVHESQSRLWENLVGRSRGFWEYYFPKLQRKFGKQLKDVTLDQFYRAINKVQRSLIRVDADEVTYNLHVILRFDLEMQLLEGSLSVNDLPHVWRARYKSDLGIEPPDDKDGVLQDVHWYGGIVGGSFQGYTLGNIMSGMFYAAATQAHPEIPDQIRAGRFGALHKWLVKSIYRHGEKYTTSQLIQRITGGELTTAPYLAYLRGKYGELYDLSST